MLIHSLLIASLNRSTNKHSFVVSTCKKMDLFSVMTQQTTMATYLPTTPSSVSSPSPSPSPSSSSSSRLHCRTSRFHSTTNLRAFARCLEFGRKCSMVVKAQQNPVSDFEWFQFGDVFSNLRSFLDMLLGPFGALKVSVDGSSNDVALATPQAISDIPPPAVEAKDPLPESESSPPALATEESISEFIAQVSSLVKLVNSKDIVELELRQLGCELLIRKKEALPQPPTPSSVVMMHSSPPQAMAPPSFQAAPPVAAQPPSPAPASVTPAAKSAKSSHPPFKCPMAGTFYRCPGPNEPPFVKVGDKVQKGQVICIIEAMKLMNEIEADQAGTVVEVVAEDGKPVSVDTPLFVIQP